jgi:hypothetical protein
MKRKLKRFFLIGVACVFGLFLCWRLLLAYLVSRQLAAVRDAGYPTSGEELNAWWAEVPDAENAALPLQEVFGLMQEFPSERAGKWSDFRLPPRRQLLTEEQREFLADYVALNAEALARADNALQLPKCRFPMDFSWGALTPLPHVAELKRLGTRSEYVARLALGSNRPAGGADRSVRRTAAPLSEVVQGLCNLQRR